MLRLLVEVIFLVQTSSLTKAYAITRTSIRTVVALGQSSIHLDLGRAVRPLTPFPLKARSDAIKGSDIDEAQRLMIVGTLFRQNIRVPLVLIVFSAAYLRPNRNS